MSERIGGWIQTYTGKQFWPLDPRPEEVCIEDIAHALSNTCRFAGHCKNFYSVAEHSVLVSLVVPPEDALAGLLHDATEAYLLDIPTPIKKCLDNYGLAEQRLWLAIADAFDLNLDLPVAVHRADHSILLAEKEQIMNSPPADWRIKDGTPAAVTIGCVSPSVAEEMFLIRYKDLTNSGA